MNLYQIYLYTILGNEICPRGGGDRVNEKIRPFGWVGRKICLRSLPNKSLKQAERRFVIKVACSNMSLKYDFVLLYDTS